MSGRKPPGAVIVWSLDCDLVPTKGDPRVGWVLRKRKGYEYPDDPTLLGEVLLRGFAEGA